MWTACLYATASVGVILFQVALIFGAPWGRITQGGTHEGPLPTSGRVGAFVSIFINAAMALAILSAAGLDLALPGWCAWVALGLQAIVTLLNWITPSAPERKLWAPITTGMLLLAGSVVLFA